MSTEIVEQDGDPSELARDRAAEADRVTAGIFARGVIVGLQFSASTGTTQLKPEDIGLESIPENLMNLGRMRLLPKDKVSKPAIVQAVARKAIEELAIHCPFVGQPFVPLKNVPAVKEILKAQRVKCYMAVDKLLENYPEDRENMMALWRTEATRHFGDRVDVDRLMERLAQVYPSPEEIRRRFRFEWNFFKFAVPTEMSTEVYDEEAERMLGDQIEEWVGECVRVLQSKVAEVSAKLTESLARIGDADKMVPDRSRQAVVRTLDTIRALNFFDHEGTNRMLDSMRGRLEGRFVSNSTIESVASEAARYANESIDEMVQEAMDNLSGMGRRRIVV